MSSSDRKDLSAQIDGQTVFEVESILNERQGHKKKKGKFYLIRWKGYGSDWDTYEPEGNINAAAIEDWEQLKAARQDSTQIPDAGARPSDTNRNSLSSGSPALLQQSTGHTTRMVLTKEEMLKLEETAVRLFRVKSPVAIIGATKYRETLMHLVVWDDRSSELVVATVSNRIIPQLVIGYYQSQTKFKKPASLK